VSFYIFMYSDGVLTVHEPVPKTAIDLQIKSVYLFSPKIEISR
jgi:hypothetical protein